MFIKIDRKMKRFLFLFATSLFVCVTYAQKAVDLGLSVKWADRNVDASTPLEQGGLYAWGETETKGRYQWGNYFDTKSYKELPDGHGKEIFFKYFDSKNIKMSGTKYDVARVKWGGKWRMPTLEEYLELRHKCKVKEKYNGRYVQYYEVTAPNGNSILFPSVQFVALEGVYSAGGAYWAATLNEDERPNFSSGGKNKQLYMAFAADFMGDGFTMGSWIRMYGLAVRPVMDYDDDEYCSYKEELKAEEERKIERILKGENINRKKELADYLEKGIFGYSKNIKKAFEIYRMLSEYDTFSKKKVAGMYDFGIGVEKSPSMALKLYADLAIRGDVDSRYYLIAHRQSVTETEDVRQKVAKEYSSTNCDLNNQWDNLCCLSAALCGNEDAMIQMAEGFKRKYDFKESITWYEKAVNLNNVDAMYELGKLYLDQTTSYKNVEKGIELYTKAAENGHQNARTELGKFYKYGIVVKKDKKKAKQYLGEKYKYI